MALAYIWRLGTSRAVFRERATWELMVKMRISRLYGYCIKVMLRGSVRGQNLVSGSHSSAGHVGPMISFHSIS